MSEKLYKLTDQNGQTHGATQWGAGVTHTAPGGDLCTAGVLHAYRDPLLALLLNPLHGNFRNPRLWEAKGEVCSEDWGKVGCTSLTTLVELPLPEITVEMRVRFALLCAAQVIQSTEWLVWAEGWWFGRDRSEKAAEAAEARAAWAAEAESRTARMAARAAEWMARPIEAAVLVAKAAARVAEAAARVAEAAAWAARTGKKIDFITLAHWACDLNK